MFLAKKILIMNSKFDVYLTTIFLYKYWDNDILKNIFFKYLNEWHIKPTPTNLGQPTKSMI
jgi:hypothetical protein